MARRAAERAAGRARVARRTLSVSLATLMVTALVLSSPRLLQGVYGGTTADWRLLSDMGQAYGAISALLAAAALFAIGGSIYLQAKEVHHAREQAARATQN